MRTLGAAAASDYDMTIDNGECILMSGIVCGTSTLSFPKGVSLHCVQIATSPFCSALGGISLLSQAAIM